VRQHNGAIRFITLEGYRGAIEINTFSRVCKVVWPQLYVSEIITYGVTDKCITYDGRSNRFYQQDNDVSDAVNAIISSAMKDITKTYRINYAIDYPEHVAITCGDGSMQMLRVAPR
jgi:hypothetical protein